MLTEKKAAGTSSSPFFTQLAIIFFYFAFFYNAALSYRGFLNLAPAAAILIAVFLNGGFALCASAAILFFLREKKSSPKIGSSGRSFLRDSFLPRVPLLIVVTIFSILALLQFDNIARYDAGLYYTQLITATKTFQFDPGSLLQSFALSTHPTQGATFWIGAGEMLFPMKNIGVYIVTLPLTIVSFLCLYEIIGVLVPRANPIHRALGVALFAFNPYVLGLFSYTNPDYYLTLFFIILVWSFQKNWHILGMFTALLVCFSKEPGILFAASFLLTAFFMQILLSPGKGFFRKAFRLMWPKNLLLYGLVPIAYAVYFLTQGNLTFASSVTSQSPLRWDSSGIHCFGFNAPYILARALQLLVYNFFWIPLLLGAAAAAFVLIRGYRARRRSGNAAQKSPAVSVDFNVPVVIGISASTYIYFFFSCLFITHLCPRYAVCVAFPAAIVSVWALTLFTQKVRVSVGLLSVIAALFIGQCYAELDPSIRLTCHRLDLGTHTIYSPTTKWYATLEYLDIVSDMFAHNQLYTYADDLTNEALKKMDIKEDDVIAYVMYEYMEIYLMGDPLQTDHPIYWDPAAQRRTYENHIEGAFVPRFRILGLDLLNGKDDLNLPDHFYLMTTNHIDLTYLEDIERRGYRTTDSFTVENNIGLLRVYTFEKETD